jgi:hypothetical protein
MVRTQADPLSAVSSVQQAIWSVDKNLATYDVAAMIITIPFLWNVCALARES